MGILTFSQANQARPSTPQNIFTHIINNDLDSILNLAAEGTFDFQEINSDGDTPLIFAARHGDLATIQTILSFIEEDRLTALTARDRNLNDALSVAINRNATDIAEFLRQSIDTEMNSGPSRLLKYSQRLSLHSHRHLR